MDKGKDLQKEINKHCKCAYLCQSMNDIPLVFLIFSTYLVVKNPVADGSFKNDHG